MWRIQIDLSGLDTSEVTSMAYMFKNCELSTLKLSFDTSKATNMNEMFYGCSSLTSLDLSSFNTLNISSYIYMLQSVSSGCQVTITSSTWNTAMTESAVDFSGTFTRK